MYISNTVKKKKKSKIVVINLKFRLKLENSFHQVMSDNDNIWSLRDLNYYQLNGGSVNVLDANKVETCIQNLQIDLTRVLWIAM